MASSRRGSLPVVACLALLAASPTWAAAPLKTVILGIEPQRDVDPALCRSLDQVVLGQVSIDAERHVLGQAELQSLLQLEAGKAAMGCDADNCLAEIAQAMDADRVISGSMDRLGSSYLVVLTELDAREVRVIARVQKRLSTNEDRLFRGVEAMARDLVSGAAVSSGESGTLIVTSTPPAEVFVDGESYGGSPAVIGDLAPGTIELEMVSGGDRLVVEAPVGYGKATNVDAKISITKGPTAEELQAGASAAFWGGVLSLGEILVGVPWCCASPLVGCLAGAAFTTLSGGVLVSPSGEVNLWSLRFWSVWGPCTMASLTGAFGLIALSASTFILGPAAPEIGPPEHLVVITPAEGEGDEVRLKIDPASGTSSTLDAPADAPAAASPEARRAVGDALRRSAAIAY